MTVKNQWLKKPSAKTDEILSLYQQGLSTNQIGKRVGLHQSCVGRRLKKVGVILRKSADYEGEKRYWLWKGTDHIDPITRKRNQRKLQKWSKAVRERDGNICKDCGTSGRLHAHHIVRLQECVDSSLEFDISNGVTLCPKCHGKRHKLQRLN